MQRHTILDALGGVRRRMAGKPRHGVELDVPFVHLGTQYGGYGVVLDRLGPDSVVYSFGIGEDISFDLELIARTGCRVVGFDPTPRSVGWVRSQMLPEEFTFQAVGLAHYDGHATFAPPANPLHVSHSMVASAPSSVTFPVRRLHTLMSELGHKTLSVLKMDIEGAEYGVLDDLVDSRLRPEQILLEFHHGMYGIDVSRTDASLRRLRAAGYCVFDVQPTGREFSLLHSRT